MGETISLEQRIGSDESQAQVDLFLGYYEIDLDDIDNEKARDGIKLAAKKVKKAIMKCRLEIKLEENDLVIVQKLKKPFNGVDSVTYQELNGDAKIRMKDCEEGDDHGKVYALMGGLCGETNATMRGFKGVDHTTMEAIASLFLAA